MAVFKDAGTFFDWDRLLSSPGLCHLATEVFLYTGMESFAKLEHVCRAWRDHIHRNKNQWNWKRMVR